MRNRISTGYASAVLTVIVWGTTFTSTKILLRDFSAHEILFFRSLLAFLVLYIAKPQKLVLREKKHELLFACAGLCGITLYHLFENYSLSFTAVANTSLIVATSPFFIALLSSAFLKAEKPGPAFYLGFLTALTGTAIISFNGRIVLALNPMGDILALCAALSWALYSILSKLLSQYEYGTLQITRRIFGYNLLFLLPVFFFSGFRLNPSLLIKPVNLLHILYLGAVASAMCFGTWNYAIQTLGALRTSVFIYLIPVISVTVSAIVLREPVTMMLIGGAALTLSGLFLSEYKVFLRRGELGETSDSSGPA